MSTQELVAKYEPLSESGISADEFFRHVRGEGVSKFYAMVLLRDLFNQNLMECLAIVERESAESAGE
jgi:hypothetical protein